MLFFFLNIEFKSGNPYLIVRWLFVTEEDIKGLPCFQVSLSHKEVMAMNLDLKI